jgi:hypothetical protein
MSQPECHQLRVARLACFAKVSSVSLPSCNQVSKVRHYVSGTRSDCRPGFHVTQGPSRKSFASCDDESSRSLHAARSRGISINGRQPHE